MKGDPDVAVLEVRTRPDVPPAALRAENLANLGLELAAAVRASVLAGPVPLARRELLVANDHLAHRPVSGTREQLAVLADPAQHLLGVARIGLVRAAALAIRPEPAVLRDVQERRSKLLVVEGPVESLGAKPPRIERVAPLPMVNMRRVGRGQELLLDQEGSDGSHAPSAAPGRPPREPTLAADRTRRLAGLRLLGRSETAAADEQDLGIRPRTDHGRADRSDPDIETEDQVFVYRVAGGKSRQPLPDRPLSCILFHWAIPS